MNLITSLLAQIDPAALAHEAELLAGKSDRTLFIATLIVMLASGIYIVRFLSTRNDALTAKLEEIARESNKAQLEVAKCLSQVSDRLDAHTSAIHHLTGKSA